MNDLVTHTRTHIHAHNTGHGGVATAVNATRRSVQYDNVAHSKSYNINNSYTILNHYSLVVIRTSELRLF